RSKYARRSSVSLSARGAGRKPFSSNLARINESIGFATKLGALTRGIAGLRGFRKDHQEGSARFTTPPPAVHGAPSSIHCFRISSSAVGKGSLLPGGILRSPACEAA